MATQVLNREKLINEIWVNKGKVGLVAQRLGVTSKTIYNYADRYATVKNAIDDARAHADEVLVDTAELKLQAAVMAGEAWSIRYTLGTKGKDRGYVERNEVEHSGFVGATADERALADDELERWNKAKADAQSSGTNAAKV